MVACTVPVSKTDDVALFQSSRGEVYDVIKVNLREKPGVSVRAVRSLWDAQSDQQGDWTRDSPSDHAEEHPPPPTLPPKTSRKPEVSVQIICLFAVRLQ